MLTHRRTQRKTLLQEANRAGSRVAAQARDVASGAGEVARTATSEIGGLRRRGRRRADRKMARARHAAASGLQGTASRLASAADVVENGRRQKRRWPRVAALVGVVVAAGVVVATRVRSTWNRDATSPDEQSRSTSADEADKSDATGQPADLGEREPKSAAQRASSGGTTSGTGGSRRKTASSSASTARDNGGR